MILISYGIKAWLAGIAMAAVVGPISMLFIKKTLVHGVGGALAVGIGTALADFVYGMITALGLSTLSHLFMKAEIFIHGVSGFFLICLGYYDLRQHFPSKPFVDLDEESLIALSIKVFFLTLASPLTLACFLSMFGSIVGSQTTLQEGLVMSLGASLGSLCWWVVLGGLVLGMKHTLSEKSLRIITLCSACVIICCGVFSIKPFIEYLLEAIRSCC